MMALGRRGLAPRMRNVWILAVTQMFAACGTIMLVTFGGIVGTRLAPSPMLATLPLSLGILGTALASIPAALLMRRIGRKPVFMGSVLVAAGAALLFAWGVAHGSFVALCASGVALGANMAVVQQYRFAATEYVDLPHAGQAVATVMLGTLGAAILGPELGNRAKDLGGWPEFTGSYVALAGLCIIAAAVVATLGKPLVRATAEVRPARALRTIAREPTYVVAVLAGVSSFAVMSFIMTATPISMHVHDHMSVADTKNVISAHLLGMYLPSLASGWLARTIGDQGLMLAGIVFMFVCIALGAFVGHEFMHYFWGLLLLGVGWNFLFVAGTTLLTSTYTPAERFKAQGFNDFAIFGTQAVASLLAAPAIESLGWSGVNIAAVPLLVVMLGALLWLRGGRIQRKDAKTRSI
jgi:MFS family permease